jgi:hypothetical protein
VQHSNANSIVSLQLGGHEECTILVSKNNNKYRLQGTSYQALWLPLVELTERLKVFFSSDNGLELSVDVEEDIPLPYCMACIDAHFAIRQKRRKISEQLELAAAQVLRPSIVCYVSVLYAWKDQHLRDMMVRDVSRHLFCFRQPAQTACHWRCFTRLTISVIHTVSGDTEVFGCEVSGKKATACSTSVCRPGRHLGHSVAAFR